MTPPHVLAPMLPERITRFPFPFPRDEYRYSANVQPAPAFQPTEAGGWGDVIVDVDEHYAAELAARAEILAADPDRSITLPHMEAAAWDAVLFTLQGFADARPDVARIAFDGDRVRWENDLLDLKLEFTVGDASTLPADPLTWLCSQVQEDICLLDQREGHLWLDAGLVTFAADWSLAFDIGMSFLEFHGPVPRVHEAGIMPAAEQFLMRLTPEQAYRRTNWTLTIDRRLDVSTEEYEVWGKDRRLLTQDEVGDRVHLRVEVQHLVRLPVSGAVMFTIRSSMLPMRELLLVPEWARRAHAVIAELPDDMADYKGIARYRHHVVAWLEEHRSDPIAASAAEAA